MIPHTPLLMSPDLDEPFGVTMSHTDLMKGLRRCSRRLHLPDPDVHGWYPGRAAGHTSLWLGAPFIGRKITTFHLGALPEWTQVGPDGAIIRRGWRSVMEKVVLSGAVTKARLEREFKITLTLTKDDTGYCEKCRREGKTVRANGTLCDVHRATMERAEIARQIREENKYLIQRSA